MKPTLIRSLLLLTLCTAACAGGSRGMTMDDKSDHYEERLAAMQDGLNWKMTHWFASVFTLVILPCIAACYALADKLHTSLIIQIASGIYSIVEALVLRFPDPDGHENRTSRGTAWFLMLFYGVAIFNGAICEGTNLFVSRFKDSRIGKVSSRMTPFTYKILSVLICECGFVKAAMNIVAILGFCYDDHTGQCNAHGIMGMSFMAYGWFLATMLVIPWLRINRHKYSQEMYDSCMLTAWGIVNTFTEHRPWEPWSHHDYQHTSMGIIFWACGMLGIFLSRHHKRNFMPALTLIFTGYAMCQHPQHTYTSEKVHTFFGMVLILGGASRIAEISFVLNDRDSDPSGNILSFQYLPPFALVSAGVLFMGANEEQVQLVIDMGADHAAYIMCALSAACLILMFYLGLLEFYLHLRGYTPESARPYDSLVGGEDDLEADGNEAQDDRFQLDDFSSTEGRV